MFCILMNKKIILSIVKLLKIKKNIKNYNLNYLESGIIDSLEMIKFISKVEKKFKIKFSQKDFENREFTNIIGLSKIIQNKKN